MTQACANCRHERWKHVGTLGCTHIQGNWNLSTNCTCAEFVAKEAVARG